MKKTIFIILLAISVLPFAIYGFAENKTAVNIGLLAFSGDTSGIDQGDLRRSMSEHLEANGFASESVSRPSGDGFQYYIGVEFKKNKKTSEVSMTMTLFDSSGKIAISRTTARVGADDSIRPKLLKGLDSLTANIR